MYIIRKKHIRAGFFIYLKYSSLKNKAIPIAQLAGAVEYTDCVSAEGLDPRTQLVSWIWH